MEYAAVFRTAMHGPDEAETIREADRVRVCLHPGGFELQELSATLGYGPPHGQMNMRRRPIEVPPASYLVVEVAPDFGPSVPGDPFAFREYAMRQVAEIGSLAELRYPGLLLSRTHEGIVSTAGWHMWLPAGPLAFSEVKERDSASVATSLHSLFAGTATLSEDVRGRFQLAARWFLRGLFARDPFDRLIYWWTVLEVHPAQGTSNVPRETATYLSSRLSVAPDHVKSRLSLGRLHGLRSDVVHDGRAFVSSEELCTLQPHLDRLGATVRTCLRMLAGLEPGDALDPYL